MCTTPCLVFKACHTVTEYDILRIASLSLYKSFKIKIIPCKGKGRRIRLYQWIHMLQNCFDGFNKELHTFTKLEHTKFIIKQSLMGPKKNNLSKVKTGSQKRLRVTNQIPGRLSISKDENIHIYYYDQISKGESYKKIAYETIFYEDLLYIFINKLQPDTRVEYADNLNLHEEWLRWQGLVDALNYDEKRKDKVLTTTVVKMQAVCSGLYVRLLSTHQKKMVGDKLWQIVKNIFKTNYVSALHDKFITRQLSHGLFHLISEDNMYIKQFPPIVYFENRGHVYLDEYNFTKGDRTEYLRRHSITNYTFGHKPVMFMGGIRSHFIPLLTGKVFPKSYIATTLSKAIINWCQSKGPPFLELKIALTPLRGMVYTLLSQFNLYNLETNTIYSLAGILKSKTHNLIFPSCGFYSRYYKDREEIETVAGERKISCRDLAKQSIFTFEKLDNLINRDEKGATSYLAQSLFKQNKDFYVIGVHHHECWKLGEHSVRCHAYLKIAVLHLLYLLTNSNDNDIIKIEVYEKYRHETTDISSAMLLKLFPFWKIYVNSKAVKSYAASESTSESKSELQRRHRYRFSFEKSEMEEYINSWKEPIPDTNLLKQRIDQECILTSL